LSTISVSEPPPASVLEMRRKVLETEEIELRLQALEEKGRDR
jgi:hypothetical protein